MAAGEIAGRDQDVMLTPIAAQQHAHAQALQHGQVGLLPGVIGGCSVPAHTG